MVVEAKRKADESALVPANKKSKNEVAVKNKNNSVLQAVSADELITKVMFMVLLYF